MKVLNFNDPYVDIKGNVNNLGDLFSDTIYDDTELKGSIEKLNESLADYGIDNVATTFYQGWYTDQGVPNTVRTDFLNCSAEDIVSVKCANTFFAIYAVFYDGGKNQLSIANASNTKELSAIAPNNTDYCIVNVVDNKDISPSTIGKVSVYVNNAIDELKNDLGGLTFSASGTTLSITDGTNTWTLNANS